MGTELFITSEESVCHHATLVLPMQKKNYCQCKSGIANAKIVLPMKEMCIANEKMGIANAEMASQYDSSISNFETYGSP